MSTIAENITRIQGAKNDIRTAIVGKGVDVPADAHIDEYAGYIQSIKTGGGGGGESSGKVVIPNGIILSGSTFSTIDMSNWDWSRVYDWGSMFQNCSNLETIENFPSDVEVLYIKNMYKDCVKLTTGPMMNLSKLTDISQMFYGCSGLTSVELSDTSNITNMSQMFYNCKNLTAVPQFDTSNVTDMSLMFAYCQNLTAVPQFDTSNVTSMYMMFYNCKNLTAVPQFDTSKVTNMSEMFYNCSKLKEVRFTGNPINLTSVTSMTQGCPQTGTLYYPAEYADAYQTIINAFPSKWVKVAE